MEEEPGETENFGRANFFPPKGNYYSIENKTTKPARVFFAQGCEVSSQVSSQAAGDMSEQME